MHLVLKSHIMQNPVRHCFKCYYVSQVCLQTNKTGEKTIPLFISYQPFSFAARCDVTEG